jgi:glutathione S-transferase
MIEIWGRNTSSNVQLVMWAVAELGLEHQRIDRGGTFGGLNDPEYRKLNPHGLIPTIRDGDHVVWESAAILRYLAARYGSETFWPGDPAQRAPLDMWAEWIKTSFAPTLINRVFWQLIRTPPAERDQAVISEGVARLKHLAVLLDARLDPGPYLNGAQPCFADIMIGHTLYRYFTVDFERADTPNLERYYRRLQESPAYRNHVMVSYESLRAK